MDYPQIKSLLMQIDDPVLKLETVMDFGKQISSMRRNCSYTTISGCVSRVEICRDADGVFYGDADSVLVRGIVAIMIAMANFGIKNMRDEFATLNLNLGAGRLSGVQSMIKYFEQNMV